MGYRSEVFLGVKKELENKLNEVMIEYGLDHWFTKNEHNFKNDGVDDKWIIYRAEEIKWYEGDEDVDAVTDVIDEFAFDDDSAFAVALGEDGALHSEIGIWFNYLDFKSEIVISK